MNEAYQTGRFREVGHALVDELAAYLDRALAGDEELPVLPWVDPEVMAERWAPSFSAEGGADPIAFFRKVIEQSIHLHHPRYIGHQVSPPVPIAILADLVTSALNNGNTIYEMSPVTTAMERGVIAWMAGRLGFGDEAGGIMTSGGSLGNLTALLAARQAGAGFDLWEEGAHAGTPLCVLGSEEAHYSVGRALHVMGWGSDGYIPIPTDAGYRLRADLLEEGMDRARSLGRTVVGVVAHAGTTGTGSVDRLDEISAFCRKRGLWLHVDGAHGASVILSEKYRGLLSGIERADSVVWDAHKMMAIPALATGVVFRDGLTAYQAFSEKASYLFEGRREEEWFNLAHRTVECTKRTMSLKVYAALAVLGTRWFSDYVTATLDAARLFADMLDDAPDFATATSPETNIVCFRHLPDGLPGEDPAAVDAHQAAVRRRVLEDGGFYIVQTRLREALHLRVTLSHPDTSESDLRDLMDHIRQAGAL